MEIYRDFKEFFELLNAQKVEYVVVGGYALAHHGAPRYTRDIDVYVRPTPENAQHVQAALEAFGFGQTGLKAEDFEKPDQIIQFIANKKAAGRLRDLADVERLEGPPSDKPAP